MTAAEKTILARFIDLTTAYHRGGYRSVVEREYCFHNDEEIATIAAPIAADKQQVAENPGPAYDSISRIADDVRACQACSLCRTRKNAVPGEGVLDPQVMVIGEGPGADEDASGRPFVGRAGQLLDRMLDSIGLSRERNCFIANVVKCRPPDNRDPRPEETAACASFIARQIQLLKPRFILSAGRVSAQTLLNTGESLGRLRGKFFDYPAGDAVIPLIVSYHPSALLRNEDYKRPAWEDLKLLRSRLAGTNQ